MDQIKIGNFIQTIRKEKGLTQKELAEKLGVSDKAVSKWETGNGMPDISLLQKLCATLNININEFLSGEKIDRDDYNIKAEENIFQLLTQSKASGRSRKITVTAGIILFASIFAFTFTSLKDKSLLWFLDLPSLIITAGFCLSVMLIGARGQNPAPFCEKQ